MTFSTSNYSLYIYIFVYFNQNPFFKIKIIVHLLTNVMWTTSNVFHFHIFHVSYYISLLSKTSVDNMTILCDTIGAKFVIHMFHNWQWDIEEVWTLNVSKFSSTLLLIEVRNDSNSRIGSLWLCSNVAIFGLNFETLESVLMVWEMVYWPWTCPLQ